MDGTYERALANWPCAFPGGTAFGTAKWRIPQLGVDSALWAVYAHLPESIDIPLEDRSLSATYEIHHSGETS